MNLGPHRLSSCGLWRRPLLVLGALAWIVLDYRAQQRPLDELKRGGVTRRSKRRQTPGRTLTSDNPSHAAAGLLVLLPLVVFLGLALLFLFRLGTGDPSRIRPR